MPHRQLPWQHLLGDVAGGGALDDGNIFKGRIEVAVVPAFVFPFVIGFKTLRGEIMGDFLWKLTSTIVLCVFPVLGSSSMRLQVKRRRREKGLMVVEIAVVSFMLVCMCVHAPDIGLQYRQLNPAGNTAAAALLGQCAIS